MIINLLKGSNHKYVLHIAIIHIWEKFNFVKFYKVFSLLVFEN